MRENILTQVLSHRSVPTKDDILVPETLLKKRKSQEKEREARAADLKKKRDVSRLRLCPACRKRGRRLVMTPIFRRTRLRPVLSLR